MVTQSFFQCNGLDIYRTNDLETATILGQITQFNFPVIILPMESLNAAYFYNNLEGFTQEVLAGDFESK